VHGDDAHPANRGRLCSKGAALAETLGHATRLLVPEIDGQPVDWETALAYVANGFMRAIAEHGPESVAFYVSGQLLTEDYYAANKLMKGYIGAANIDTNSRLCMSSSVAGHVRAFGADVVPGCYEDLELADLVVMTGSNAAWCHPVLWQRIIAARRARPDMRIVVIDPRATATTEDADLHLALHPGSDVLLFNGLFVHLMRSGRLDSTFLAAHVEGRDDALAAALADAPDPSAVALGTGLSRNDVEAFYALFAHTERTVTCYSQGVNQSSAGTDKVNAIINCHLATGRIGRPGMGPFSLTGQPNAMGGREVGGLATQLAAHLRLDEPAHRALAQAFWASPRMVDRPGLKAVELFDAMADGHIKAIWIMGTNPVVSLPAADRVRAALARCPLVVVSDCVRVNDTLAHAHVRLPALAWLEKDGTVTNSERRISRQRPLLTAPGLARADWWIIAQVGHRMGWVQDFDWRGPADVFREHARLSAFRNEGSLARAFNLGGLADLTDDAYQGLAPVQWPVPPGSQQGTARLFGHGGFPRSGGRARIVAVSHRQPHQTTTAEWPFILNTGRVRDHWHTLTRTALSPRLSRHRAEPALDLHPEDIAGLGLREGGIAQVESRWGVTMARVVADPGQRRGCAFMPMHWTETLSSRGRVNAAVNPHSDPISGQPEFKYTPVRITPAPFIWQGILLCAPTVTGRPDCAFHVRVNGGSHTRYIMAGTDWPRSLTERVDGRVLGMTLPSGLREAHYTDPARGHARRLFMDADEHPVALLALWPDGAIIDTDWWSSTFDPAHPINAAMRRALLAGVPPDGATTAGALICACHGVCAGAVTRAIEAGCASVEALGRSTGAGTGCGSCRPELRRLLDSSQHRALLQGTMGSTTATAAVDCLAVPG